MKVDVLDKGYVRTIDHMGSDLDVVNDARASFDKASEVFSTSDKNLLRFLAREGHTSPFRHGFVKFEVYAPLMVARQWWKYIIASDHQDKFTAWNESSRRYITENNEFYLPDVWREAASNKKQGSGGQVEEKLNDTLTRALDQHQQKGQELYEWAVGNNVAPEQARLFLPAYGLYVRWRWSASLQGVLWFLQQRLGHDAQSEIRDYAAAVKKLVADQFPVSVDSWIDV